MANFRVQCVELKEGVVTFYIVFKDGGQSKMIFEITWVYPLK